MKIFFPFQQAEKGVKIIVSSKKRAHRESPVCRSAQKTSISWDFVQTELRWGPGPSKVGSYTGQPEVLPRYDVTHTTYVGMFMEFLNILKFINSVGHVAGEPS